MRFVVKSESLRKALLQDLRAEGIKFEVSERLGYESFVGYMLEGTVSEIQSRIETFDAGDKEAIMEGFISFRESLNHLLEHIKVGEKFESLLREGPWVAELLDQLAGNGAIEYDEDTIKLKEGVEVDKLRFQFKFPFNLVHNPEGAEKLARQFALTDLTMEYEFEILELDMKRINTLGKIASRYFPEDYLLRVYFGLVGRAVLASEILKSLNDKVPTEDLLRAFVRASPIAIPTEKGTLVVNFTRDVVEETLKLLKKLGYVDIKAGKVKKLKDLV
ncbi:hypothetical protein [Thermococcus sp.]|uniref:hypothetical protein n=1 Tax=Thermococcus sp. TaxID=35749 RepID=UPI00262CE8C6|nr:hypothetical protein [Thermococcus sp.]